MPNSGQLLESSTSVCNLAILNSERESGILWYIRVQTFGPNIGGGYSHNSQLLMLLWVFSSGAKMAQIHPWPSLEWIHVDPLRPVAIAEIPLTWRSHIQQPAIHGDVSLQMGLMGICFRNSQGHFSCCLRSASVSIKDDLRTNPCCSTACKSDDTRAEDGTAQWKSSRKSLLKSTGTGYWAEYFADSEWKAKSAFKDHHAEARDHSVMQPECVNCNSFWMEETTYSVATFSLIHFFPNWGTHWK